MYDIVVIGHGAAGLTAALAAAESGQAAGHTLRIAVIEQAPQGAHGGNTRFTPCYMRMAAPDCVDAGFVDEMIRVSGGCNDRAYFERLANEAPATIAWLQEHGVRFHTPGYYLSTGPARIQPVGGGNSIVEALTQAATDAGVEFIYETTATTLRRHADGAITGVSIDQAGKGRTLAAGAVVLACGGFQGNPEMLRAHLGPGADALVPISPGTRGNAGAGIRMALDVGAMADGDWRGMHIEPIDPRAQNPAAVVLVYPYGIVIDQNGDRFFDEGAGLVHETWETFARTIHFEAPGRQVYAVLDNRLNGITDFGRAIRSEVPPHQASSLAELARLIGVAPDKLEATVAAYNAACPEDTSGFDATVTDGLAATAGLTPAKSNWACALDQPPFYAWPLIGAIAYTFGGIATDLEGRVLGAKGAIPGLYAAGEITGHFHGTAPNAVAVMRALVYGRLAGSCAALNKTR